MKFKQLCGATLLSALAVGLMVPTLVGAASDPQTHSAISKGRVKVEVGTLDPTDPIIDPEDPKKPIDPNNPEIDPGEDPGSLGIINVSRLNFGVIQTGTAAEQAFAEPLAVAWDVDDPTLVTETRGALVQFGDIRGNDGGYTVTAQMTSPFSLTSNTNKILEGATITYNNGIMETREENMSEPGTMETTLDPIGMTWVDDPDNPGTKKLVGNSITVVTAAKGKGGGTYVLEFGQSKDYDGSNTVVGMTGTPSTDDKAVVLDVPATTVSSMTIGDYVADITWTITAGPTA